MVIIVMGVMGCGKTTVGRKLAETLGAPFFDADDFHPASNQEKMSRGEPLTDGDRASWLQTLSERLKSWESEFSRTVLACSALKGIYRAQLSQDVPVRWVYLKGDRELIRRRLEGRRGHFADPRLLESQFAALEEPEDAIVADASEEAGNLVETLVGKL